MTIKIVTDSTADLPQALAEELGITVVPLYVQFGHNTYRDRIDISEEEFYQRLLNDPVHPSTSQPSPHDFADVYNKLSKQADGIVSIHISNKLSGTCNSALRGKEIVATECPIEVIDSEMVSMGLGLIAAKAATIASSGKDLQHVVEEVKQLIPHTHVWALFDTLKYLAIGGRIGKAKALLGSVLNIKPILVVKDGEMAPATQARSRSKGIDLLYNVASNFTDIQDLAVMYTTTLDEAKALANRLSAIFNREQIKMARLGPALGVHAGPGALAIALRGSANSST
jgi:DegV family protein with EDD domain